MIAINRVRENVRRYGKLAKVVNDYRATAGLAPLPFAGQPDPDVIVRLRQQGFTHVEILVLSAVVVQVDEEQFMLKLKLDFPPLAKKAEEAMATSQ